MTNIMNVNPYLIRYMDDQYVNAFFKEGTLMLSSIYKFTDAELGLRQDLDEGVISYTGSGYRVCGDVEDRYLVLCSSMSFHKSARCEKTSGVLIIDLHRFVYEIIQALRESGYEVDDVFIGPCNYFGRDMCFKQKNDSLMLNDKICKEDMFFSKNSDYSYENEYRFVFKLNKNLDTRSVVVNLNPDVVHQYACRYTFDD